MNRRWNDQPEEVEGTTSRLHFTTDAASFELREGIADRWYITSGNLFGSQTVRCMGVQTALRILDDSIRAARNESSISVNLYEGAVLLEEATA